MKMNKIIFNTAAGCCLSLAVFFGVASSGADDVSARMSSDPLMIPLYTGRIIPTPQQVVYRDDFVPLGKTVILVGKDVENPGAVTALLIDRISRYGGQAEVGTTFGPDTTALISLGDTELARSSKDLPAVPDREQAYVLQVARTGDKPLIVLKGRDRLGLLWSITSLIQLIHWRDGHTQARAAEVRDFPRGINRGYINANGGSLFYSPAYLTWGTRSKDTNMPDTVFLLKKERQFTLLSKFTTVVYQKLIPIGQGEAAHPESGLWKAPEKWKPELNLDRTLASVSNSLNALGLSWYGCVHPIWGDPESRFCGDEGTVKALLYYARKMEAAGGHLDIQLDDGRFPLHAYDSNHWGSAREADTWVITNLASQLKKEFPKGKLLVCPPFYWGPDGSGWKSYGEDRDAYLKAIGDRWPLDVDVWWSGQRVNGTPLADTNDVAWHRGLTHRKPFFWQNNAVTCYRAYFYHYGAEPISSLKEYYWDGFMEAMGLYAFNSDFPERCIANTVSGDFQWNPDAYNPEESVREAASKFVGPEAWPLLKDFSIKLSFFDKYASRKNYLWFYGGPFHADENELRRHAARNIDVLDATLAEVESIYGNLLKLNRAGVESWTGCAHFLGVARGFVSGIRTSPDLALYRKAVGQREVARKAGDYDAASNDYFLAASNFKGGMLTDLSDGLEDELLGSGETRPALVLDMNQLTTEALQWLWKEDLNDRFELRISARRGPAAGDVIATLNGTEVLNKAAPFSPDGPSTIRVAIPDGRLKEKDNTLKITVKSKDVDRVGKGTDVPALSIQYAVLKRIASK